MNKTKKKKNYKTRSKVYKGVGNASLFASTVGGFAIYQASTDWVDFKNSFDNFIVIQEESMKVNFLLAMPGLIALLVFVIVYRKKNSKALEGKVAFSLFIALIFLWLVYSLIETTLFAVMGAFVGSLIDETIFTPLSNSAKTKSLEDREVEMETRKERVRKRVREEIDGTV